MLLLVVGSAWHGGRPATRAELIAARNAAVRDQSFTNAQRLQDELDAYTTALRGDPKFLPASMLLEAQEDAIERESYEEADAIKAEIGLVCKLAPSAASAFSIFRRARTVVSSALDGGNEETLGTSIRYVASSDASPSQAYALLANPARWNEFLIFSSELEGLDDEGAAGGGAQEGATFKEIAGAPPLLPVQITWRCTRAEDNGSDGGVLEFEAVASDGVGDARRSITVRAMNDLGGSSDEAGADIQLETWCSNASPVYTLMQRVDELLFAYLISGVLASDGGGVSAKTTIVWSVLIFGWAASSFGWLASFGLGA